MTPGSGWGVRAILPLWCLSIKSSLMITTLFHIKKIESTTWWETLWCLSVSIGGWVFHLHAYFHWLPKNSFAWIVSLVVENLIYAAFFFLVSIGGWRDWLGLQLTGSPSGEMPQIHNKWKVPSSYKGRRHMVHLSCLGICSLKCLPNLLLCHPCPSSPHGGGGRHRHRWPGRCGDLGWWGPLIPLPVSHVHHRAGLGAGRMSCSDSFMEYLLSTRHIGTTFTLETLVCITH